MSADKTKTVAEPSPNGQPKAAGPQVIRRTVLIDGEPAEPVMKRTVPAWFISTGIHIVLFAIFLIFLGSTNKSVINAANQVLETTVQEEDKEDKNLVNTDIGIDPELPTTYDVDRVEVESVPGPVVPEEAIGLANAPEAPPTTIPPPPGAVSDAAMGASAFSDTGAGAQGAAGGVFGGAIAPGFKGRSGATKEKLLVANGGNSETEAAVARGLAWLARVQKKDGHWEIDGSHKDDVAGTALGLLPFLAAGQTHKLNAGTDANSKEFARNKYHDNVLRALTWLKNKQKAATGDFGSKNMYTHAIATMAFCEAYGMTMDPDLKKHAQAALMFIEQAQHSAGGWRYAPGQAGDTSVTGWQIQALKSGKLSKLQVKAEVMAKGFYFLDSVSTAENSQYGYTERGSTPSMTAVALLCRQYQGWGPGNPSLAKGVDFLKRFPPNPARFDIYYYYYATQVLHFFGGDDWKLWNEGPNGKSGMRQLLVDKQVKVKGDNFGSWDQAQGHTGEAGGRLVTTCLSLLTLEVYYRHLPLYKRGTGGLNELDG
jgi:hypothetical protein